MDEINLLLNNIKELNDVNKIDNLIINFNKMESIYNKYFVILKQIKSSMDIAKIIIRQKISQFENLIDDLGIYSKYLEDKNNGNKSIKISEGINLPILKVPNSNYIPDSYLYYDESTNLLSIKLLGNIISGKLMDFSNKKTQNKFIYSEFLYTKDKLNKKNFHMRHIGDKDNLLKEILLSSKYERDNRIKQLFHDIIICLCIKKININ